MARKNSDNIVMEIDRDFDFILEEGNNTSINLRRISWNNKPTKLDIRKWLYQDLGERPMKGTALTDEGADELTGVLVENGYGSTERLIMALRKRYDYNKKMEPEIDDGSEEYYDPKELLGGLG